MKHIPTILKILALLECYVVWQVADNKVIPQDGYWMLGGLLLTGAIIVSAIVLMSVTKFFGGGGK